VTSVTRWRVCRPPSVINKSNASVALNVLRLQSRAPPNRRRPRDDLDSTDRVELFGYPYSG